MVMIYCSSYWSVSLVCVLAMLQDVSCVVEYVVPYVLKDCSSYIFIDPSNIRNYTPKDTVSHPRRPRFQ